MPGFDPLVLSGFLTIPEAPDPTDGEHPDDIDTTISVEASDATAVQHTSTRSSSQEVISS